MAAKEFEITDKQKDACITLYDSNSDNVMSVFHMPNGGMIVIVRGDLDPNDHCVGCLQEWVDKHSNADEPEASKLEH